MFGIGPMEFVLIAVVAVIFVGPDKLPDVLKKFGRFYVQAKRHANDVKSGFDEAIHSAERELELERIRELQKQLSTTMLSDVIDAKHTDKSSDLNPASLDDGHTADGRLIEPNLPPHTQTVSPDGTIHAGPSHSSSTANASASAMPPSEFADNLRENETTYHEGHLPPHTRQEDHDPFAPSVLRNPSLTHQQDEKIASVEPAKDLDKDKK